jgi:VanZ family protein
VSALRRGCAALLASLARGFAALPRSAAAASALAWMATIFWLSSAPRDFLPPGLAGTFVGNAAHAPIYGLLALLAARASGSPAAGLAIAVLYGITDEWHQSFVPGRTSSVFDLATDAIGATAALRAIAPVHEHTALRRVLASATAIAVAAGLATLMG